MNGEAKEEEEVKETDADNKYEERIVKRKHKTIKRQRERNTKYS